MNQIMKGKLTYTLAALAVVYGIFGFISGSVDNETATSIIWMGLAAYGLRRAM